MLVLLNGGSRKVHPDTVQTEVALVDACVTEWRHAPVNPPAHAVRLHSLMLVLLNGGSRRSSEST